MVAQSHLYVFFYQFMLPSLCSQKSRVGARDNMSVTDQRKRHEAALRGRVVFLDARALELHAELA